MNIKKIEFHNFNQQQNMYITTEGEYNFPERNQVVPVPRENAELRWGENGDGVVSFGLWYFDEDKRPGHGGLWSSRAGVAGPMIGKELVNVAINQVATHMTLEALQKILPDEYEVKKRSFGGELWYEIQLKGDESHGKSYID